jgi:hypothetical protein
MPVRLQYHHALSIVVLVTMTHLCACVGPCRPCARIADELYARAREYRLVCQMICVIHAIPTTILPSFRVCTPDGSCAKNACCMASAAVTRLRPSYSSNRPSKSSPSTHSLGTCCTSGSPRCTGVLYDSKSLLATSRGWVSARGVPRALQACGRVRCARTHLKIKCNCSSGLLPGKNGCPAAISYNIHPTPHISMCVE